MKLQTIIDAAINQNENFKYISQQSVHLGFQKNLDLLDVIDKPINYLSHSDGKKIINNVDPSSDIKQLLWIIAPSGTNFSTDFEITNPQWATDQKKMMDKAIKAGKFYYWSLAVFGYKHNAFYAFRLNKPLKAVL